MTAPEEKTIAQYVAQAQAFLRQSDAEKFHKNFFHDEREDYEITADRPVVHRFVNRLVGLINDRQQQ